MTSLKKLIPSTLLAILFCIGFASFAFAEVEEDQDSYYFAKELSCVREGFHSATGLELSEKWLGFLAMGVQTQKNYNTRTEPDRNESDKLVADGDARQESYHRYRLRRRVIELIQTYGTCLEQKLDSSGNLTGKKTMTEFSKEKSVKLVGGFLSNDKVIGRERQVVSDYIAGRYGKSTDLSPASKSGIEVYRNVFGLSASFDPSKVFGYDDETWKKSSLEDRRQIYFESFLKCALNSKDDPNCKTMINTERPEGLELRNCLQDIQSLKKSKWFKNDVANRENSAVLCESMSKECNLNSGHFCRPWKTYQQEKPNKVTTKPVSGSLFDAVDAPAASQKTEASDSSKGLQK